MEDLESLFDIPITFSGEKGDKGERGIRGFKGDDGESVTGGKGERGSDGKNGVNGKSGLNGANGKDGLNGKSGIAGKSITGDKGEDGLSAYEIWLQEGNEGDEEKFLKSLKGKNGTNGQWHGNSFTELQELLVVGGEGIDITENTISLDIKELTETSTVEDNDEFAISRAGVLFKVTAETLATYIEANVIYVPQDLIQSEDINTDTTDAFCTGTITVNLIDPALATHKVTIANESPTANTVTMTADNGTVYPATTLTKDQSVTLAPRAPRWIQV